MTDEAAPGGVEGKVGGSAFWSTASSVGSQIIRFSVFVVLARLVSPAELGVVAIASVLVDLMSLLAVAGVSDALVRKPSLREEDCDTAFWTNLAAGVVFLFIGLAVSPLAAKAFDAPELRPVLSVLCLTFVIWPFGATHSARLARELKFKSLAIRNLVANLIGAAVGIGLALNGYGVWALVARALITVVGLVVLGWFGYPWRPKARFETASFKALFGFGSKLMGSQLVGQLNARGTELIAGFLIAPAAVGLLRVAGQCFSLLTQITIAPLNQIALPLLSRTQGDPVAGKAVFEKLCGLSALMIYPAFLGTMAVGGLAFPMIFGPDWALTGLIMPLFCALVIPLQCGVLISAGLASRGETGLLLRWSMMQTGVSLPLCAIGGSFGLTGLLVAAVISAYLWLPVTTGWLARRTEFNPLEIVKRSLGPLAAALAMAAAVTGVRFLAAPHMAPLPLLLMLIALGAAVYLSLVLAFNTQAREILGAARQRLASARA